MHHAWKGRQCRTEQMRGEVCWRGLTPSPRPHVEVGPFLAAAVPDYHVQVQGTVVLHRLRPGGTKEAVVSAKPAAAHKCT